MTIPLTNLIAIIAFLIAFFILIVWLVYCFKVKF